jgi:hypothetical protein
MRRESMDAKKQSQYFFFRRTKENLLNKDFVRTQQLTIINFKAVKEFLFSQLVLEQSSV